MTDGELEYRDACDQLIVDLNDGALSLEREVARLRLDLELTKSAGAVEAAENQAEIARLSAELEQTGKAQDRAEDNDRASHTENIELRIEVHRLAAELAEARKGAEMAMKLADLMLDDEDEMVPMDVMQPALDTYRAWKGGSR